MKYPHIIKDAAESTAWLYMVRNTMQRTGAAEQPESGAERKPGTVAADRAGLHTTVI